MAQLIKYHTNISACIQILKPDSQHPGKNLDTAEMYSNPSSVDLETRGCYWSSNLVLDSEKVLSKKKKKYCTYWSQASALPGCSGNELSHDFLGGEWCYGYF